jgi:RNA polymerase sigma factor (sigma-70 family)
MLKSRSGTTHDLLVQLKHGQDEVIEVIYPYYAKLFYAYGKRHGLSHEEAEDLVQTTFDHILTKIQTYDEVKGGGEKWMWRICVNLLTDIYRKPSDEVFPEDIPSEIKDDPEGILERKELTRCLEAAFNSLATAEQDELRRERRAGRPSNMQLQAIQRFSAAAQKCRELL